MRLAFLGSGAFGLPTLEALYAAHQLVLVITQPDRPAGRRRVPTGTPVAQWALERDLPIIRTDNANGPNVVDQIAAYRPDASVVIAFGQKLSPALIASLGTLAVNLHSSLLPAYRGAAPIVRAMLGGETTTGVSVIGLAQRMDAGAVYATASLDIHPTETAGELHDRLAALGPDAVAKVLNDLQANALKPIKQDHARATRAPKLSKADGTVNFNQPADTARCRINGLTPWPGCRVTWHATDAPDASPRTLLLRRAGPAQPEAPAAAGADPGTLLPDGHVACADGVVQILDAQLPGGRALPLHQLLAGLGGPEAWSGRLAPIDPPPPAAPA